MSKSNIIEIKPGDITKPNLGDTIFLMGPNKLKWKDNIFSYLLSSGRDFTIFNSTVDRKYDFDYIVNWSHDCLEVSDKTIIYISKDTTNPDLLLEVGMYIKDPRVILICEPGANGYRKIKILCDRYNKPIYEDLESIFNLL